MSAIILNVVILNVVVPKYLLYCIMRSLEFRSTYRKYYLLLIYNTLAFCLQSMLDPCKIILCTQCSGTVCTTVNVETDRLTAHNYIHMHAMHWFPNRYHAGPVM
jgi:hypothetical protein